ncbi:MAG TPA: hypothetical protein VI752_00580 [Candidatus Paceibacterota bacterium]
MNFKLVRNISVYIFVSSIVIVSLIGVLSIWEVFSSYTLVRSLITLLILSISFVLITLTTFEREGRFVFSHHQKEESSILRILGYGVLAYMGFNILTSLIFSLLSR